MSVIATPESREDPSVLSFRVNNALPVQLISALFASFISPDIPKSVFISTTEGPAICRVGVPLGTFCVENPVLPL